jgi:uncharacterized protein (DUF433 family)
LRAEKGEWVNSSESGDEFSGIESSPEVMAGMPCIRHPRIPVWLLEQARRLGTSEADLLRDYPTLTVQDLANAWNFVRFHRSEIEAQIEANENESDF